jgi:transcriptional regulator with GAF, ATPase, and Fis domain
MAATNWDELLSLHVVRKLAKIINRRWNLGLGFVAASEGRAVPPRTGEDAPERSVCDAIQAEPGGEAACAATATSISRLFADLHARGELEPSALTYTCHAGLQEIAVPIQIEGRYLGCLLAGGFHPAEDAQPARTSLPVMGARPRIRWHEISYLNELLELCAEEITVFQTEVARRERRLDELATELGTRYSYDAIIGRSRPMQELYRLLDKVIDSESTVLIQGENGTGKELIAKAIHYNSPRKARRFVVQNCSAFNDNLLDSELFGHRKGAFTGAIADKQGLFEVADGGTFFLDEIGDMSPALQVKVMRVLQEGTFIPVGDTSARQVDVRIIAATNRDLKRMVERGEFREDLFYRVNVINLVLPPLRERKDDIPILVDHFVKKHAKGRAKTRRLTKACLDRLLEYHWPGNVRELENEIERLVVLAGEERVIGETLLSPRVRREAPPTTPDATPHSLPDARQTLERSMIVEVLRRHHWNKTRAAADLKISRRNLIRLVQKYQLESRRRS